MATGDTLQQRGGSFGIAYESTPGTAEAAPVYFLTCEDASIAKEPVAFERVNNIGAERIGIAQSGHDTSFEFSNAELGPEELGYLLWLILGDETNTAGSHSIASVFSSNQFTAFLDHGGVVDAGVLQTQRAVGCRFDSLSMELSPREYAKFSGSGMALTTDPLSSGLTPALDLTVDNAPLSWSNFASLTLTVGGGSARVITYPRSFSLNIQREIERSAIARQTSVTREILEGGRMIDSTVVVDLVDGDDLIGDLYDGVENGSDVTLSALFTIGTSSVLLNLSPMRVMNNPFGPIGSGSGPQEVTIELGAFQNASGGPIANLTVVDGNTDDYDAR